MRLTWRLRGILWEPDAVAEGDTKSARGPTTRRESVLATERKRTCVAVATSVDGAAVGLEACDARERTIVPILDITISPLPS